MNVGSPMNVKAPKNSQGLTLIELLVTMVIIAIIASVAVPSYASFIAKERLAITTNELYNAYRFARNEALKTSSPIFLDAISSDWTLGWQVKNSSGDVLLKSKTPHTSITVSASALTVQGMGSLTSAVDFNITGIAGTNCINILSSGQSELVKGACS
jgi:type IV fimbrial biogenesis protein FimT